MEGIDNLHYKLNFNLFIYLLRAMARIVTVWLRKDASAYCVGNTANLRSLQILYITVRRAEISHYFRVKNGMKVNSVTQSDGYTAKKKPVLA